MAGASVEACRFGAWFGAPRTDVSRPFASAGGAFAGAFFVTVAVCLTLRSPETTRFPDDVAGTDAVRASGAIALAAAFFPDAGRCWAVVLLPDEDTPTSVLRAAVFGLASPSTAFKGDRADRFCTVDVSGLRAADGRAEDAWFEASLPGAAFPFRDADLPAVFAAAPADLAEGPDLGDDAFFAAGAVSGAFWEVLGPADGVRGVFAVAGLVLGGIAHS